MEITSCCSKDNFDSELRDYLKNECRDRAAANIGSERRFFQALVNALEDGEKCCGAGRKEESVRTEERVRDI